VVTVFTHPLKNATENRKLKTYPNCKHFKYSEKMPFETILCCKHCCQIIAELSCKSSRENGGKNSAAYQMLLKINFSGKQTIHYSHSFFAIFLK
jgi:hypothetical protein